MNTTIGKRGLLAAAIAGFFSLGAHAQQACQNAVNQVRSQLEQSSVGPDQRREIEDLLSRAVTTDTATCSVLVSTARQQLSADDSGSLQAQQGAQPGEQPAQPGQAQPGQPRPGLETQPGQSQASQSAQQPAQPSDGQEQAAQRDPTDAPVGDSQRQAQSEEAGSASGIDAADAAELVGNNLKTADGEEVGEISAVARSRSDSELYAIADVGGFLGIGERRVAVPLDRADVDSDGNLVTPMSREEVERLTEYDEQQFTPLG